MIDILPKQSNCALVATMALNTLKQAGIEAKILYITIKEDWAHCVLCFEMGNNHVGIYDSSGTSIAKIKNWKKHAVRLGKFWAYCEDNPFIKAEWLEDIKIQA